MDTVSVRVDLSGAMQDGVIETARNWAGVVSLTRWGEHLSVGLHISYAGDDFTDATSWAFNLVHGSRDKFWDAHDRVVVCSLRTGGMKIVEHLGPFTRRTPVSMAIVGLLVDMDGKPGLTVAELVACIERVAWLHRMAPMPEMLEHA